MKINYVQENKGFTLVETLVAISIFTMSILALISILGSGISNTTYAKAKLIGTYLAQEGIEYVRNMRDTYVLYDAAGAQTGWNSFVSKLTTAPASCGQSAGCYFDDQNLNFADQSQPITKIPINACTGTCPVLLYNSTGGKYGYSGGTNSGFTRTIKVSQVNANQIRVLSTVSWKQGTGTYSANFSEDIYNWVE